MRVDVLVACFNRRDLTVRALMSTRTSAENAGLHASFTVFDDGSTDGTAEALASLPFPVHIVAGTGDAFWAAGMARAERAALQRGDRDAVLWLNDDVELDGDALTRLAALARDRPGAVLVGSTREPDGRISYSGYRRAGLHPLRLRQVDPTGDVQQLDTFNGNFVLIPEMVRRAVGAIDGGFAHQLADIDYGFRAALAGYEVLLAPGTFGTCSTNATPAARGVLQDWRAFRSAKGGGHPASMRRMLRRYAKLSWPIWAMQTDALWWVRRLTRSLRPAR